MAGTPFQVRFDDDLRGDLLQRLARTRWSDAVTADWRYGMDKRFLEELVRYWQHGYSFDAAEERLNAMPQFRAEVAGCALHYVHCKGRGPNPKPLLLMNGWPSSFAEYQRLAPRLADPASFGGSSDDAFDVVMPALPGFGFSSQLSPSRGLSTEKLFHTLMTQHLGYARYMASGTDIGAGIATRLGLNFPEAVQGIHIASVVDPPLTKHSAPLSEAERAYQVRCARWEAEEGAYAHLHYTRPQTLAFALADSPVGLASWITEKFYFWSDLGAERSADLLETFPLDMLLDNLMIYWATGTIGSSMRVYYDHRHFRAPFTSSDFVRVPTAVTMWPKDLVQAPREWAARFYHVQQYATPAHGGHFPAWEAPEAYASELRRFARSLRMS